MSNMEPSTKPKRGRTARQPAAPRKEAGAAVSPAAIMVSAEQRRAMIAEAAYLRAERRGFTGGDPTDDWLQSEKEVDTLLSRSAD